MTLLSEALQRAVDAEQPRERLRAMLAVWRLAPVEELAVAIERLGDELDRPRATIAGKTVDARIKTWLALEKAGDDELTGWLLASPPLGDTLTGPYKRRLARVARWKPDPRLASALLHLLEDGGFAALPELWQPVYDQLAACRDRRVLPRLIEIRASLSADDALVPAFDRMLVALAAVRLPAVTSSQRRQLAALVASPATPEARLLEAVWAAPGDDAPRLVYADWLQERGDPRGELIALQCRDKLDPAGKRRVRELVAQHGLRWLAPLAPAILEQKPLRFERGFLSACTVCVHWGLGLDDINNPRERAIRALVEHPAWSTLREVRMAKLGRRTRAPLIAHLEKLGVGLRIG